MNSFCRDPSYKGLTPIFREDIYLQKTRRDPSYKGLTRDHPHRGTAASSGLRPFL